MTLMMLSPLPKLSIFLPIQVLSLITQPFVLYIPSTNLSLLMSEGF